MVRYLLFLGLILNGFPVLGQDSIVQQAKDTTAPVIREPVRESARVRVQLPVKRDTVPAVPQPAFSLRDPVASLAFAPGPRPGLLLEGHPYFRFTDPVKYEVTVRKWQGKEVIFYSIIGLLLFFAILRNSFYRYVQDLFRTYFRTTVKQKQVKDQLLQNPLPSLLFNVFFTISVGMFLALVLQHFGLGTDLNFWMLYLYCMLGLIGIYGVKFITLKLLGWLFQLPEVTDSYIFVVFTTNKIIGMVLLPFVVVLAFAFGDGKNTLVTMSLVLVIMLLVYRFFLSYTSVRGKLRVSFFHFLIYLLAFEIAPLLLINKLLFRFLGETP